MKYVKGNSMKNNQQKQQFNANSLERLENESNFDGTVGGMVKNFPQEMGDAAHGIGNSMWEQLLGNKHDVAGQEQQDPLKQLQEKQKQSQRPKEMRQGNLFNGIEYRERNEVAKQVMELKQMLAQEVEAFKKASDSLESDVMMAEKEALENLPNDQVGTYHITFLEIVLRLVRTARQNINQARTWLQAAKGKKNKRGSLFARQKTGKHSDSHEQSMVRSVQ